MEQKRYLSVVRMGHRTTEGVLQPGDPIVVMEKIDGANASFMRDGDKVRAFSRNTELSEDNTLGGFYQFTQTIDPTKLLRGFIYFGEWTNPRKVKYPDYEKQFFLFDVYNTYTEDYASFTYVREEAEYLGFNLVPVFYEGLYQSYEHLQSFVGKTKLGGRIGEEESGEGIVIKNPGYKDRYGKQVFMKMVIDKFREVQPQKAPTVRKIIQEEGR